MKDNERIKKALNELEQVSGDEKLRRIAELREKAIRDENAAIEYAKEEGYNNGLENGKNLGARGKQIEIAKSMLKENIEKNVISKVTGLSIKEIEKLEENEN